MTKTADLGCNWIVCLNRGCDPCPDCGSVTVKAPPTNKLSEKARNGAARVAVAPKGAGWTPTERRVEYNYMVSRYVDSRPVRGRWAV